MDCGDSQTPISKEALRVKMEWLLRSGTEITFPIISKIAYHSSAHL